MAAKTKKKAHTVGGEFETTIIFPTKNIVCELRDLKRDTKKRVQGQNGKVGQKIGDAVENEHLNRKAHNIACQLDALDDETLHLVWHSLLKYADDMGVIKRATAQEELFDADEMSGNKEPDGMFKDKEPKAGGTGGGAGATNVVAGPGRQVREAAGKDD